MSKSDTLSRRLAKAKQRERERLWMLPSSSLFAWRHDEVPESLQIAFKEFQLNDADPLHWNHLLKLLAEVIYGKDEKKGPPKRWTDESLMSVIVDYEAVQRAHPENKGKQVFQLMIDDKDGVCGGRYKRISTVDGINKMFQAALKEAEAKSNARLFPKWQAGEIGVWANKSEPEVRDAIRQMIIEAVAEAGRGQGRLRAQARK
jgi:hypothetical protein